MLPNDPKTRMSLFRGARSESHDRTSKRYGYRWLLARIDARLSRAHRDGRDSTVIHLRTNMFAYVDRVNWGGVGSFTEVIDPPSRSVTVLRPTTTVVILGFMFPAHLRPSVGQALLRGP